VVIRLTQLLIEVEFDVSNVLKPSRLTFVRTCQNNHAAHGFFAAYLVAHRNI